jgi:V/A-type H+/Na+-transporting ATPase subunit I
MIIPMTRYTLLVYHREYQDFLDRLRELGVVHIVEKQREVSDEIRDKYQYTDSVDKTIRFLMKRVTGPTAVPEEHDGKEVYEEVVRLQNQVEHNKSRLNSLKKDIHELEPWGDFSRETLSRLEEQGVYLKFFVSPVRQIDPAWKDKYTLEEISTREGQVYFVVFSTGDREVGIPAEEVSLPPRSLNELKQEKVRLEKENEAVDSRFAHLANTAIPSLENYKRALIQDLEYNKAVYNTGREADDRLMILEGWVPRESVVQVNSFIDSTGAAYVTSEPEKDEKVPVKLKNNAYASKFEKIGELYSLPSYKELDITPFFAPFYALFFGFCLGDAGYGLLIVTAAMIARAKVNQEFKPVTVLVSYLGLATIFFGIISGVFFGILLYDTNLPVYSDISAMLSERGTDINMVLFYLAIVLGAIQIIFGMIIKAANETIQFGWKFAVGTYGWLTLILGSLIVYLFSIVSGIPMERLMPAMYTVLIVSGIMILFLNNLYRNILTNFGIGLWNTYNMGTGLLGDLLSYIRLFALGISSAILGLVFNTMAVSMSGNIPVVSIIIMILILAFGHSINLFMSGLGSFVHPLRLTFVEFYKNAGFTGGGMKYNPFRKIS